MITFKDENDLVSRGYVLIRYENELRNLHFGDFLKFGDIPGKDYIYIIQKALDCECYKVTLHNRMYKMVVFAGCMEDAEKIVEESKEHELYYMILTYLKKIGLRVSNFRSLYDGGILNLECVDYCQSDYEDYETFYMFMTVLFGRLSLPNA